MKKIFLATLKGLNMVLSVGSPDGILTSAAVLRHADLACEIQFSQAFMVDSVKPEDWEPGRVVLFVDLAVNSRDNNMTREFLQRVKSAGHTILGVLDEHNAGDWERIFQEADMSAEWESLQIFPVSQETGDIKSSGGLFLSLFGEEIDEHSKSLCEAADAADQMDYSTKFGSLVNSAVKSRIADDSRRVYMAKHFAMNSEPDEKISGWIKEYEQILQNHVEILAKAQDLGDGIIRMSTVGLSVDMTSLMKETYDKGFILAVCEGEFFNKDLGKKVTQIGFGLDSRKSKLNLVDALASVGIVGNGFSAKVNVLPEQEVAATEAIRLALQNQ